MRPWFEARRRWTIHRRLRVQRWRIQTGLRVYRGNGLANFEFEFRFGFPRHSRAAVREVENILALHEEDFEAAHSQQGGDK